MLIHQSLSFVQVPAAVWSPFFLSLVENLVNRNGILNFFHDHLRQAVETKYLSTPDLKQSTYLKLADFFASRRLDDRVVRQLILLTCLFMYLLVVEVLCRYPCD